MAPPPLHSPTQVWIPVSLSICTWYPQPWRRRPCVPLHLPAHTSPRAPRCLGVLTLWGSVDGCGRRQLWRLNHVGQETLLACWNCRGGGVDARSGWTLGWGSGNGRQPPEVGVRNARSRARSATLLLIQSRNLRWTHLKDPRDKEGPVQCHHSSLWSLVQSSVWHL